MPRAFVIRPFGPKKDSANRELDFERVQRELIGPALEACGLPGGTTGEIIDAGNVREDMFALILEADLVVCDVTIHNANVFYELGIRHALRRRRTVLIKGRPSSDAPPFDLLTDRYMAYSIDDPASSRSGLIDVLRETLASDRETDSPIFKMLPTLREADTTRIGPVVPLDLAEEIDRAEASESAGWLRLLAADVAGLRFEWPALRLIGKAQRAVGDQEGAYRTWRRVIENNPEDIAANFALADLLERQYRRTRQPEHLTVSDHCIERVLGQRDRLTDAQRAEAIAMRARNGKTVWRLGFEGIADPAESRRRATTAGLMKAYSDYHEAYLADLNALWPGLAALQMGTIALDLATDARAWADAFPSNDEAASAKARLKRELPGLQAAVPLAVTAELHRLPRGDKRRVWAELGPADISFLLEKSDSRVIAQYVAAVPRSDRFAWGSVEGQLKLFAGLGFRATLVAAIIEAVEQRLPPAEKAERVVIFAGHLLDAPHRPQPRFPPHCENKARDLLRDRLQALKEGDRPLHVLASAAPGSDILCHEICRDLGIQSTICLPMPRDAYAAGIFGDLDSWRTRYLALLASRPSRELSDRPGLPRWLGGRPLTNPWERGNRWVLEMARTAQPNGTTLLALWDGKEESGLPGGTAHMVGLAREAGTVQVIRIDAGELLA